MRLLFALLAATLSLCILPATGLPGVPAAVTLAAECTAPTLQVTLDPERSEPQAPHLTLHATDLALPASGRFEWGDGRYGIARLGGGAGSDTVEATISPAYQTAGDYTLSLHVTDACGTVHTLAYTVSVPLALPPPAQVPCPGMVDPSGVCVVGTGERTTLTIDGGPAGATWTWHGPAGMAAPDTLSHTFGPQPNRRYLVQASAPSEEGWVVTPVLRLIGLPVQRAAIAEYEDPRWVVAGRPVQLGFTPPEQLAGAPVRIELDGQVVAESTSATVHLEAGDHVVRYIVTAGDGRQVQRQILIVADEDLSYLGPIALVGGAAGLLGLVLLFVARRLVRRRRRRRAVVWPPVATPVPALSVLPVLPVLPAPAAASAIVEPVTEPAIRQLTPEMTIEVTHEMTPGDVSREYSMLVREPAMPTPPPFATRPPLPVAWVPAPLAAPPPAVAMAAPRPSARPGRRRMKPQIRNGLVVAGVVALMALAGTRARSGQ